MATGEVEQLHFDSQGEDWPIESVTVFVDVSDLGTGGENYAEVTRMLKLKPPPGVLELIIEGLPTTLKADSIRAELTVPGAAKILEVSNDTKTRVLKDTEYQSKIKELTNEIRQLQEEITRVQTRQSFMEMYAQSVINSNEQSPEQGAPISEKLMDGGTLEKVGDFMKFYDGQNENCDEALVNLEKQRQDVQKQINKIVNEQANSKQNRSSVSSRIILLLDVQKGDVDLGIKLMYLVTGAFWRAMYDARAKKESMELTMTYYGEVENNSGEDWKNVNVALSTARPSEAGALDPLPQSKVGYKTHFNGNLNRQRGAARRRQSEIRNVQLQANMLALNVNPMLPQILQEQEQIGIGGEAIGLEEFDGADAVLTAGVEAGGGATNFHINRLATILSDGKPHKQTIGKYTMTPAFTYAASPKMSRFIYLKCSTRNDTGSPFLKGPVAVFIDGSFIAYSFISAVAVGEDFGFFLGIDQTVKLEWSSEQRKDESSSTGVLVKKSSKERRSTRRVKIVNTQNRDVVVTTYLQVPVAQAATMEVRLLKPDIKKQTRTLTYKIKNNVLQVRNTVKKKSSWTFEFEYAIQWTNTGMDVHISEKTEDEMVETVQLRNKRKMKKMANNNARFAMQQNIAKHAEAYDAYM